MFDHAIRSSILPSVFMVAFAVGAVLPASAQTVVEAVPLPGPIQVDGDPGDWAGIPSHDIALTGRGGVDTVAVTFGIYGDTIYLLAIWDDATESRLHKPYRWDEGTLSYRRTRQLEDRFAISFEMSGVFSHNKLSGDEFTADVWHWKASRSDPAGIAHDKMWKVSRTEFPGAKKFINPEGQVIYLARPSDAGDRLYRAVKHETKHEDLMPRYEVNLSPSGSVADVRAKGVWRDGRWYLELARKLDTGHDDDAVIPASGRILFAIAAHNDVDNERHSVSETFVLHTGGYGN